MGRAAAGVGRERVLDASLELFAERGVAGTSLQMIAERLGLTKRAVEKHIAAIFEKLDVSDAGDVSRRVAAALIYIAEQDGVEPAA